MQRTLPERFGKYHGARLKYCLNFNPSLTLQTFPKYEEILNLCKKMKISSPDLFLLSRPLQLVDFYLSSSFSFLPSFVCSKNIL